MSCRLRKPYDSHTQDMHLWMFWWLNLNTFLVNSGLQTKTEVFSFHAWSWLRTFTLCRVRQGLPTAVSLSWDFQQIMIPCYLYKKNTVAMNFVKCPSLYIDKGQNLVLTVNLPVLGLLKYSLCIGWTGQWDKKGRKHRTKWVSGGDRRQNKHCDTAVHSSASSLSPWDQNLSLNLRVISHVAATSWEKKPSSVPCTCLPKERWTKGQERRVCNSFAGKLCLVKTGKNLLE